MPFVMEFQRASDRQWRQGVDEMLRQRYATKAEEDRRREWQDYLQRRSYLYFKTSMGGEREPTLPGDAELSVHRPQSPTKWKAPPRVAHLHPRPFLGPSSSALIYGARSLDGGNPHHDSPLRHSSMSSRYLVPSPSSESLTSATSGGVMSVWQESTPGRSPGTAGGRTLQRTHSSFAMLRPEGVGRPKRAPAQKYASLPRVGSASDVGLGQWGKGWHWTLADAEADD